MKIRKEVYYINISGNCILFNKNCLFKIIGFIEKPILINVPAFIGIALGYFNGFSKFPHAGHVLISTWGSLFHVIMALGTALDFVQAIGIFIFLFLAVWIPCCTSDIIYPLLFPSKPSKENN